MYKVIKLKTMNNWVAQNYAIFKCEMAEAEEILKTIDVLYTTAKFFGYDIYVATYQPELMLPRIIVKLIGEKQSIIMDIYTDSEYLIQDILLNNGGGEDFYGYTQAKKDNMLNDKVIEEFNHSTVSIVEKIKMIIGLL